jgi:hypothetical protein
LASLSTRAAEPRRRRIQGMPHARRHCHLQPALQPVPPSMRHGPAAGSRRIRAAPAGRPGKSRHLRYHRFPFAWSRPGQRGVRPAPRRCEAQFSEPAAGHVTGGRE